MKSDIRGADPEQVAFCRPAVCHSPSSSVLELPHTYIHLIVHLVLAYGSLTDHAPNEKLQQSDTRRFRFISSILLHLFANTVLWHLHIYPLTSSHMSVTISLALSSSVNSPSVS